MRAGAGALHWMLMSKRPLVRLLAVCALFAALCQAASLRGTVKDSSGAAVPNAGVAIENQSTGEKREGATSIDGAFLFDNLAPGSYKLLVRREGFEDVVEPVEIGPEAPAPLAITLNPAPVETEIEVSGKRSALANADPNYRALREGAITEEFSVENVVLRRDAGVVTLKSGVVGFLAPVLGRTSIGVFRGRGSFHLDPAIRPEVNYLTKLTGKPAIDEEFDFAVLVFTDGTYAEITKQARPARGASLDSILASFRNRMRHRFEQVRSIAEFAVRGANIPNLEAELLGELYNPGRGASFRAYMHGAHRDDLRFLIRPDGAIPAWSPEEVAVINYDPLSPEDGVWYLTHRAAEWRNGTADNDEDKRAIAASRYRIETTIGPRLHLGATAEFEFEDRVDGDRVIAFGLLPDLRVQRVTMNNREIGFIQEGRQQDSSFYVVMPEPMKKGSKYRVRIDYEGDKVIEDQGGGSFSVGARTSWYPSVNAFRDRAIYDLVFKIPHQYRLAGVGKLVKEWKENGYAASEWATDIPFATAGFNFGYYNKKEKFDDTTHYDVEAYATRELPSYMRNHEMPTHILGAAHAPATEGMSPSALADSAITEAMNAVRCFSAWFGEAPFGRIAITQQPEFNFGQSWPTLVYLPVSAFLDDTQRWELLGNNAFRFAEFIQEVIPHEVSHQWWGHMVGWSSLHDQWLSEGFADFSAGLYLDQVDNKRDEVLRYWDRARKTILGKNQFGIAANDAGPVWMGLRLATPRTAGAYNQLVYSKGGYALYMLRGLMWDQQSGDRDFIAMMHDFVKTYGGRSASTDDFMRTVERHMKPGIDLDGNGRIAWFFKQWLYGTDIPSYRLKYSLEPAPDGKTILSGTLTQSGVPDNFKMRVPTYLEYDGKLARLGSMGIQGNSSREFKIELARKPRRVVLNAMDDVLARDVASEGR